MTWQIFVRKITLASNDTKDEVNEALSTLKFN